MPALDTISRLLCAHARDHPDSIAIVAPGLRPLTYARLYDQVCGVARILNSLGLGRQDPLALLLPNGPEMAVAFLATSACATSAPLNPAYRAEQFEFYLADLDAKALLIHDGLDSPARAVARSRGIPVVEVTSSDAEAGLFTLSGDPAGSAREQTLADPDDIALTLHTSGTTARPKRVPLTQRNVCASALSIARTLRLTELDRCLNVMPLFHIHGLVGATLSSLASGGSVICTAGFDPESFMACLMAFQPTWYTAVPTMHQAILAAAPGREDLIARHPLRFIRSSSSSLPPTVMAALEKTFDAPVIESYGMTEAAHQMASNPLPPTRRKPGAVGLPAGPEVALMAEASSELLDAGETGEIVIRGANVMSGYENNPEANRVAFSSGWFRTGDQGRFDADGYLFVTGRLKEMINRGGEKISPREIDEALLKHPAVAQAIAFAIPHAMLGEDVAAAIVCRPQADTDERELRQYLFGRLEDFKIPTRILLVDEIPKGPTGKLRRIGLAEVLADHLESSFEAPEGRVEEVIAGIWAEVLATSPVGRADNFFALGGDSIRAVQVVARLRAVLEIELLPTTIFREPVLSEQAAVIERKLVVEVERLPQRDAKRLPTQ